MHPDLSGLCVLVTRPLDAGLSLCHALESHGANSLFYPTIDFVSLTKSPAFISELKTITTQDILIFTSKRAVIETFTVINNGSISLKNNVNIVAIGEATAKALQDVGMQSVIFPVIWNSENVLALPLFQMIKDKFIMIVKGKDGRELLESTLKDRGAMVSHLDVYARILPSNLPDLGEPLEKNSIHVVICTSYASLFNLLQLNNQKNQVTLKKLPLIVVSDRLKALAESSGFQTIWVAQNAGNTALLEILAQKKDVLCQKKKMN